MNEINIKKKMVTIIIWEMYRKFGLKTLKTLSLAGKPLKKNKKIR